MKGDPREPDPADHAPNRVLKNPPFTFRQAQGERRQACNRWRFSVRAEPVKARIRLFQHPAKRAATLPGSGGTASKVGRNLREGYPANSLVTVDVLNQPLVHEEHLRSATDI